MKRGVWLSGLVVSLGGWGARLDAQDPVWHATAPRLLPAAVTGAELPAAVLGRPFVIAPFQRVPPAAGSGALTPVSYQEATEVPPAPVAPTPSGPPPVWPDEADDTVDQSDPSGQAGLFASDRTAATPVQHGAVVAPAAGTVNEETESPAPSESANANGPTFLPDAVAPPPVFPDAVDGPVPDAVRCRLFVRAEYLLWGVRSYHIPPLVTTGSAADPIPGAIGQPHTQVLFGNSNLGGGLRSGVRLTAGGWFDPCEENGVEVSGFYLGDKTNHFATNTAQNPIIARPFFDLNRNLENAQIVSFPGLTTGTATVSATSRLFGAEANYRGKLCCGCDYRFDVLAGFRFLELDEDLKITENIAFGDSPVLGPAPNQGDLRNQNATAFDDFHTRNRFYGGQVGVVGEKHWGPWSLEGRFKLALGATVEEVTINGAQQFLPNTALNAHGDLLALQTNIGKATRTRFCVVPETDLNVGYQVTPHLRAFLGYDFLYWSTVVRPGDQIDRVLDVTNIPNFALLNGQQPTNQARPAVPFKERGFWAQGMNVGIEFRY
jgi:hypothetical protein